MPKGIYQHKARSEATKKKLSNIWKNPEYRKKQIKICKERFIKLWQNPEYREKQIKARTGKKHSQETRQKISGSHIGLHHSEETKEKIRLGNLNKIVSEETRKKMNKNNWLKKKGVVHPMLGKHLPEEQKRKISLHHARAWKGRHHSEESKEKMRENSARYWLGKIRPEKTRKKMSISRKGKNHWNWKGGISETPYPFDFNKKLKELIRERDNYTCQLCSKKQNGRAYSVHHIDYDKNNLNPTNLITLCVSCNSKANSNREYWENYFKWRLINARNI